MLFILYTAVIIDLLIGDPDFYPHPVILIGKLISWLEKTLRSLVTKKSGELIAGAVIVLLTVTVTYLLTTVLIMLANFFNFYLGLILNIWLLATTIAIKGLSEAGYKVYRLLRKKRIIKAQQAVGQIVGRDTEKMDISEIIRATVETIAENTSDGIIAPLFYYMVGGTPLAMAYKAVNTLDSMLGYKNSDYLYFGRAAARLDDLANFIPARLTAIGFCFAAFLKKYNWKQSFKIILRDASKHSSLNAGYPEAAIAGALEIRLGGQNFYQGEAKFSSYLGDKKREIENRDIYLTIKLMRVNIILTLLLFSGLIYLFTFL